jgi:hypothetical protein
VTAEGPTGAPLRQQIAEAIHAVGPCDYNYQEEPDTAQRHLDAADAVLNLLNLTEEEALLDTRDDEYLIYTGYGPEMTRRLARREGCSLAVRYCTPWLPTPPDTGSSETT